MTVQIIDKAAIVYVNMRKPKQTRNFGIIYNLIPFLKHSLQMLKDQLEVVWDQYLMNSLKQQVCMAEKNLEDKLCGG